MHRTDTPRILVAALKGGAGKTLVSLGIVRAWCRQGLRAVPFKKGPDYIDAGWLALAAGHPCYNLDPFLMAKSVVLESFARRAVAAEIALIEGNRGLFDGVDEEGTCSSAQLARWLDAPVVLVLDCTKMTRTAAALVLGCRVLDPALRLEGVILNNIARSRHETMVRRTVEHYTGIPVLGALPRMKEDPLPMRHLGVTPCQEHPAAIAALDRLARRVDESIDMDAVRRIASRAGPVHSDFADHIVAGQGGIHPGRKAPVRIGVLRDAAFQFYYPENIEALEKNGAQPVFFNALREGRVPDIDALYIGGGFPETQAAALAENRGLREMLRLAIDDGLPVYAECGGLMYLGRHIHWQGRVHPMVGALGWDFHVGNTPAGHGYSVLEVTSANPFFDTGTMLQGHEFHYSRPVPVNAERGGTLSCRVVRGHGFDGAGEGLVYRNVFATYTHLHALERPDWAERLVAAACRRRGNTPGYRASRPAETSGDSQSVRAAASLQSGTKVTSL